MTDVQIEAGTLLADEQTRTVTGLLLPYGEVGNTNLGTFEVPPGTVALPRDPSVVTANVDHDREQPVGRATALTDTPEGVVATFQIGDTDEGDELLASIARGERSKLSVEVKKIVLRAGKLVSGSLFGAAFVHAGAFPSAALMAADVGELGTPTSVPDTEGIVVLSPDADGVLSVNSTDTPTSVVVTTPDETSTTYTAAPDPQGDTTVTAATVPNTLTATATSPRSICLAEVSDLLYAAAQGTLSEAGRKALVDNNAEKTLFAALSDVKFDGTGGLAPTITQPQWIGEVWSAVKYQQQVVPLFDHADLKSLTINGFSWGTKASGGDWAGNKAQIPSNTLTVSPVTATATRYAVGHDIAREFVDFNVPGFFESYAAAVSEDYAKWVDNKVATAVLAGATTLAGDALTTLPGASGGTIGSAASAIIDGAAALVTQGTLPTFALVATALWKQMAKMPQANVTGYLNTALGLSEGDLDGFVIRPSASVAAGKVLVGAKQAVTVYELPGAPIRIDALNLAQGGVDKAAFGYAGVNINDANGLRLVTAATS